MDNYNLDRTYKKIYEKKYAWSSYVCFAMTIMGKKIKEGSLKMAFRNLVDKKDYDELDFDSIFSHLLKLTNETLTYEGWCGARKIKANLRDPENEISPNPLDLLVTSTKPL